MITTGPHPSFEELRRVNDGKPATRCIQGPHNPIYVVEPGDMTHYEVAPRGDVAIAVVGTYGDEEGDGIVAFRNGNVQALGKPSTYSRDVLTWLARLALGHATPMPECLASRRSTPAPDGPEVG